MPHVRIVMDEYDDQGAVYINGTKVTEESPLCLEAVATVLRNNLGIDIQLYIFSSTELEEIYEERDYQMPDQLSEFGDLVSEEDRTLGKGLFSAEED